MNKSDLRTGMVVTTEKGHHYQVFLGAVTSINTSHNQNILVCIDDDHETWMDLNTFKEDLTFADMSIVKVEVPKITTELVKSYEKMEKVTIWKRQPIKKMTLEEIEKCLGYKVQIVTESSV